MGYVDVVHRHVKCAITIPVLKVCLSYQGASPSHGRQMWSIDL